MEIQHLSHWHPLTLKEEENKHDGGSHSDIQRCLTCKGCLEPIILSSSSSSSSSSYAGAYYSCAECKFFLHKLCAELPLEMDHHTHPKHKLKLQVFNNFGICDVCKYRCYYGFTSNCSKCDFDIDIICATQMERKIDHESHIHPLIRLRAPQLSMCHACGKIHKGIFYCLTCLRFLIHEDCFSLPTTVKHSYHDDDDRPLIPSYSLPSQNDTFDNCCDICDGLVVPRYWLYYCAICRFFAHVNCAISKVEPFCSRRMSKVITEQVKDSGVGVIRFPVVDQSITLISYILTGANVTGDEIENPVLNHFSHDHPLILNVQDTDSDQSCLDSKFCLLNDTRVDETICNACVRPIFATPFYSCNANQCNFFLHKCCAELPTKIDQHPSHPEHPLILIPQSPMFFNLFECKGCHLYCNGFAYNCPCCNFYLDVQCGSLPNMIKYEAHHPNHILSLRGKLSNWCNACYSCFLSPFESILAYRCNSCDFELDSRCALLAHKVRHRYDEHPFILTYSPVKYHSDDYYCKLCEGALNPKWWFYHCVHCDKSIHVECLRPFYRGSNIKYGSSALHIERHQHPLALGPVIHRDTKCNNSFRAIIEFTRCNLCSYSLCPLPGYVSPTVFGFGFRCVECNFTVCYPCAAESCNKDNDKV